LTGRKRWIHPLQPGDDGIPLADRRPFAAVDVEAQDSRGLSARLIDGRIAVDGALDDTARVLGQAHAGGRPGAVRQKGEVKVALGLAALRRRLMPRVDETCALAKRVAAQWHELEHPRNQNKSRPHTGGRHQSKPG